MKKKGFTLIELLAVIVILAIIALIAVPIVLNMIENARKSAAKSSAYGYIQAIDDNNELAGMDDDYQTGKHAIEGTDINISTIDINIKGKKPTKGTVTIDSKGNVSSATLCINNYKVTYTAPEVTNVETDNSYCGGGSAPTYTAYTPGQLVQFDPVANDKCTSGNTCYKWRVITVGDTTSNSQITLQMDHNLGNTLSWVSQSDYNDNTNYGSFGNTNKGPITILKALASATSDWNNDLKITYTYNTSAATNNYGTLSCNMGTCSINNTEIANNVKARIITAEEVSAITVNGGAAANSLAGEWELSGNNWFYFSNPGYIIGTQTSGTGNTQLSWLVENTESNTSGATSNTYGSDNGGYWTLSPLSVNSAPAWQVNYQGKLFGELVSNSVGYGIRPVITIDKSKLS